MSSRVWPEEEVEDWYVRQLEILERQEIERHRHRALIRREEGVVYLGDEE